MEWDEIRKATRVRCIRDVVVNRPEPDNPPMVAFIKDREYDTRLGIFQNYPLDVPVRALYVSKNEEGIRHYIATEKGDNEFFNRHFEIVRKGRK